MAKFLFKCKVPLGAYSFIPEFLSLYKTAYKILLPNSYQILLYVFLNVVYIRHSVVIFSFEKTQKFKGAKFGQELGLDDVMFCQNLCMKQVESICLVNVEKLNYINANRVSQ